MTFEPTADDGADCMNVGVDAATLDAIGARFEGWHEANVHAVLVARFGKKRLRAVFQWRGQALGRTAWSRGT
jgi:hypothetical protein